MNFGERLTELRKEKGFTRESFADYLELSKYTLRNYEIGTTEPNSGFLKRLSKIFDVSIDYLLCATDEKERILPYQLKTSEYDHIKKYRNLDEHGRITVDYILDREAERTKTIRDISSASLVYTDMQRIWDEVPSTPEELESKFPPLDIDNPNKETG